MNRTSTCMMLTIAIHAVTIIMTNTTMSIIMNITTITSTAACVGS